MLEGKRIGLGITASHCTYEDVVPKITQFTDAGATVVPIITHSVLTAATRFGTGEEWIKKIESISGEKVVIIHCGSRTIWTNKSIGCNGNRSNDRELH